MLIEKDLFETVENELTANGVIRDFESENGKITGRMMITLTDIPDDIEVEYKEGKKPQAFTASFDFYDMTVGLALYTDLKEPASGIWMIPQAEDAEVPSDDWINFFIEKLFQSINDDGTFGIPIYSFVNDTCDMTIVPEWPGMAEDVADAKRT